MYIGKERKYEITVLVFMKIFDLIIPYPSACLEAVIQRCRVKINENDIMIA